MNKPSKPHELMTFEIAEYVFGIDINDIQEINCHAVLSRVPVDYDAVAGVINLRGEVLTVLALGRLLGIKSPPTSGERASYVVVKSTGGRVAIAVDKLKDVETIPAKELQNLPANFQLPNQHVVRGLVQRQSGILLVLDSLRTAELGLVQAV